MSSSLMCVRFPDDTLRFGVYYDTSSQVGNPTLYDTIDEAMRALDTFREGKGRADWTGSNWPKEEPTKDAVDVEIYGGVCVWKGKARPGLLYGPHSHEWTDDYEVERPAWVPREI